MQAARLRNNIGGEIIVMKNSATVALAALLPVLTASSEAATIVIPSSLIGVDGGVPDTSPLGQDHEVRFQQVFGSALLSGLNIGDKISGITFRVSGLADSGVPAQTITNYEIRLSQSVNAPGSLSMTFASNRGVDEVIVRSGALVIAASDFAAGAGAGPEPLGAMIGFNTPYTYIGGNLLLEIAYTGFADGRGADQGSLFPGSQQIFTLPGVGSFSAAVADYSEVGVFVTGLRVNEDGQNVPEPGTMLLVSAGLGVAAVIRRRR